MAAKKVRGGVTAMVLICLAFGMCSCRREANHAALGGSGYPEWGDLALLFGKAKDSAEVKAFVAKWKLSETTKGSVGSFSPGNCSYTIGYGRNLVVDIHLMVLPWPKGYGGAHWTEYKQKLPFGLQASDRHEEITKKLGKRKRRNGSAWHHKGFSLRAHFRKADGVLSELSIAPIESPLAKLPPLPKDWMDRPQMNMPPPEPLDPLRVELAPGKKP